MPNSRFLAIDLGAESGRAFIGTLGSGKLVVEEVHRFPNIPVVVSGHLRWDIYALFREVKKSLKLAAEKGNIESIGIDTWGVDFGFVKKQGGTLDLPYSYRDSRTNGIMQKVFEKIPEKEIYARTGIQLMQINSLYQLYSVKKECGASLGEFNKLLFMPDLMNFFLTGEEFSEYTIASTSQMLNAVEKDWDEAIFSKLDLPIDIMAPIVQPGEVIGPMLPEILDEAGIKSQVKVVAVGSHDTASAIAAVPAAEVDWAYLSSGTWSLVGIETERPIINESSMNSNFTNEGGVGGKINFLQNIMGMWLLQEVRRIWEKNGEHYSYDALMKMAEGAGEFKCIVDPGDSSFLNPPDMKGAIVEFCKKTAQPCPESKEEFIRCIFESLAFKYRAAIERINVITGKAVKTLHIVGGGAQNELLSQLTADAAGVPVIAGPVEAAAIGNILVQAIAGGKISSIDEGRKVVARSFQLKEYFPQRTEKWDEAYKRIPFDL